MNVAALIVTFNRLPQLQHTLRITLGMQFHTVLVVNNASTDGTTKWLNDLSQQTPQLKILNLPVNSGGAGGFSAGLSQLATQPDWTHICLFDDDAWPAHDWLEALKCEPEADGYCSNVTDLSGQRCLMNLPFTRLPTTLWMTLHYALRPDAFRPTAHRVRVASLSFVGACLARRCLPLLQRALVAELYLYYDDLSAGIALARQGAYLLWSPNLRFHHAINPNAPRPAHKHYYATRNLLWLPSLPAGALWTPAVTVLRLARQLYQALVAPNRKEALRGWLWGVADGLSPPLTGELSQQKKVKK